MSPWYTYASLQHWNGMTVDASSFASMLKESIFVSSNSLASPCKMRDERNQTFIRTLSLSAYLTWIYPTTFVVLQLNWEPDFCPW